MNKIISISVVGILFLSGFSIVAATSKYTTPLNQPPNDPRMFGPTSGIIGRPYFFVITTSDPENQNVSYFIDWGDGTSTGWTPYFNSGKEVKYTHTWYKVDEFTIRCKAKDIYNAESNWSSIVMPIAKNKVNDYSLLNLSEKFTTMPLLSNIFIMHLWERFFEWSSHTFHLVHFLTDQ